MRKTGFILAGLIAFPCVTMAQTDDFDNFMNEELKSFDSFISDANRDFINFLRDPWKEFDSEKPVEKRVEPEPVKPIVYDEAAAPKDEKPICLKIEEILNLTSKEGKQKPTTKVNDADDLDFERPESPVKKDKKPIVIIRDTVKVKPVQKPVAPKKEPVAPNEKPVTPKQEPVDVPKVQQPATPVQHPVVQTPKPSAPSGPLHTAGSGRSKVTYLGQSFYFSDNLKGKCTLAGVTENKIADAYETLCKSEYKPLLKELRQAAAEMQMNDWGLYRLVEAVAKAFCSTDNEAVVMQQFIFNELGYKTKMARENGKSHMILFVATDCAVYGHPFFEKDGQRYYCMSLSKPCQFLMCQQDAASARNKVSMVLKNALTSPAALHHPRIRMRKEMSASHSTFQIHSWSFTSSTRSVTTGYTPQHRSTRKWKGICSMPCAHISRARERLRPPIYLSISYRPVSNTQPMMSSSDTKSHSSWRSSSIIPTATAKTVPSFIPSW